MRGSREVFQKGLIVQHAREVFQKGENTKKYYIFWRNKGSVTSLIIGSVNAILMKSALGLLRMGPITVPHFLRDTKQKNIFFLQASEGVWPKPPPQKRGKGSDQNHLLKRGGRGLTKNTSSIEVGKASDQKHLLNGCGGMVVIEWDGHLFTRSLC